MRIGPEVEGDPMDVPATVFVVSDLTEGDNLALARALAPSVFAHIIRSENNA